MTVALREIEAGTEARIEFTPQEGVTYDTLELTYVDPAGTESDPITADETLDDDSNVVLYSVNFQLDEQVGLYGFTWTATEPALNESGTFYAIPPVVGRTLDPTDVRVLIPRLRRALFGPARADHTQLTEDEMRDLAADTIAELILLDADAFGYQLLVTATDPVYGAPCAWQTSEALSEAAQTVIAMQGALGWHARKLSSIKTSSTIRDESTEWSYSISAQALRDYFKHLQAERDAALAALRADNPVLDRTASILAARDSYVAAAVEPFTQEAGLGGQEQDWRFGGVL